MQKNNFRSDIFGFINVNKPKGMTSFDVVAKIRKICNVKQVGHTGTLDPFATGVLPICIGKATKLIEYLPDDKRYRATVQFGKNTQTYDTEGEVTQYFDKKVTEKGIREKLKNFEGEILQYPPIYSAIKVNGKKLYEYARKGQKVEIKPRKVTIYNIKLENFNYEKQSAVIDVECSKGTYIRSIAYDLGKILECGGFLSALERTKAGVFNIENSVELSTLENISDISQYLINPLSVMSNPIRELTESEKERVPHGMPVENSGFQNSDIVFLVYGGKIYAIGMVEGNKILVKKLLEVL